MIPFIDSTIFNWVILPLLIFLARICDVSIGTVRVIFISRGQKLVAPLLGFLESGIWLLAIRQIIANLNNVFCFLAYAGGFATGTYVGLWLVEKISFGTVIVRVITHKDTTKLMDYMKVNGLTVTCVDGDSDGGKVKILYATMHLRQIGKTVKTIKQHNPDAVYSIEDVRTVSKGMFHPHYNPGKKVYHKSEWMKIINLRRLNKK